MWPFSSTNSKNPIENPLENASNIVPSDQGDKEQLNKVEGDKPVKELTFYERIFGKSETDPDTGKPKKRFYFFGGKTKKSKSKGKKTRKARK